MWVAAREPSLTVKINNTGILFVDSSVQRSGLCLAGDGGPTSGLIFNTQKGGFDAFSDRR